MEFHGLHAFLYDCVPSVVWRVDRINVGLHVGRRRILYSILPGNCRHWKSCGMYIGYHGEFMNRRPR